MAKVKIEMRSLHMGKKYVENKSISYSLFARSYMKK